MHTDLCLQMEHGVTLAWVTVCLLSGPSVWGASTEARFAVWRDAE